MGTQLQTRDIELSGDARIVKGDVVIVDADGNIDAPVTTTNLSTSGTTTLGDNVADATVITGTATVGSTLGITGNVAVNTNKFTVAASSGNTVVAGTLLSTGLITATAGVTSVADIVLESGTAVPATAGAVAAGAPVTLYSTGIVIEVTSDAPTHTRPKGSICINTGGASGSTRMYVNTDGAGTWTAFTTAA